MKRILLAMAVLLASCSSTSSESEIETEEITGTQILADDNFEGGTCRFFSGDTLVFWCDNPQYIYTFAMVRGDSIISLGNACKRGQGPRECTFASMFTDRNGNLLSITSFSGTMASINRHSAAAADFIGEPMPIDSIVGRIKCSDLSIVPLSDDSIFFIGGDFNDLHQIFSILDVRNKKLTPLDFWPDDGFRGKDFIKANIYSDNARLFTNNKGKYAYSTGPNRNAFIFTIEGKHVNIIKTLYDNPIKYEESKDGANYKYKPDSERLRMKATLDAIYFLMIDKDGSGAFAKNSATSKYGDIVLKYDWDGNLLKKYHLDRVVFGINITDNDSTLYCQTEDPETGETLMYRYSLK